MTNNSNKNRSVAIDAMKGLAIIAVVLYHFGANVLPYGYLGVDVFFVVGGFLLVRSVIKQIQNETFNFWPYFFRKIVRLWPLVIIVSFLSVVIGYILMLPDDYENLCESVIASVVFLNNVLQCLTTRNYWDVVNMYKPLMHFWYISVLMQAYFIIPLVYMITSRLFKKSIKALKLVTIVIALISFVLFCLPFFRSEWKFYYLPFRLFEISVGGIVSFVDPSRINNKIQNALSLVSFATLFLFLFSRIVLISSSFMLIIVVISSATLLITTNNVNTPILKPLTIVGERSYSIYVWHQPILAFLFYSVFQIHSFNSFILFVIITTLFSFISFEFVEKNIDKSIKNKKKKIIVVSSSIVLSFFLCLFSFKIYRAAGVVRDVPELNVYKNNVHRGMHAEYCDRPYSWNNDFSDDDRIKVLIIGNSFARDWANILYEWNSNIEISYIYYLNTDTIEHSDRIGVADYVFYAVSAIGDVPEVISELIPSNKLYIVGNKRYGESNGIVYSHRFSDDYFSFSVELSNDLLTDISRYKKIYRDHFVDMMEPVMIDETHARVFTDEKKYISQDCLHLTEEGAKYYARVLSLDLIIKMK